MDSRTRMTVAVGVAAGYVVGRNNKERLALGLLSLVTGRAMDPVSLIGQGLRKLAETPQFEQLSESLTSVLEEQTRSLLEGAAGGETEGEAPAAEADQGEDFPQDEAEPEEAPPGLGEPAEPDAEDAEPPRTPQPSRAGEEKTEEPSARKVGPRNPGAAKAKAMGSKARAERAARRPGPKNPPAARAVARKAADKRTSAERSAGKGSSARS